MSAFMADAVGRPNQAMQPDAKAIGVSYDQNGNVAAVTPPGRPADDFSYDLADQETQYTLPDADSDTLVPGYDATNGQAIF
jgi:YD repeat-containing protein